MYDVRPRLYFDFVDPGSLLVRGRIAALGLDCTLVGFEMRPPPDTLVDPADPAWTAYWDEVAPGLRALGCPPRLPPLVPWTRKAHELMCQAEAAAPDDDDLAERLRDRVFRAYVEEGADIGRIDVLVPLAEEAGLDRTETRAVLDVDRWRDTVEAARADAVRAGVRGVPTLLHRGRRLEGVHDEETLRAFLGDG